MSEKPTRQRTALVDETAETLTHARECYEHRAWKAAYEAFAAADRSQPLAAADLERFALSAYLIGRDDEYLSVLDRAHRAYLDADDCLRASRCAFWCGVRLLLRGETGRSSGWLARAQRLLDRQERECAEQGYMLVAAAQQHVMAGELDQAHAASARAVEVGERFNDADLTALARHLLGRVLIEQGEAARGFVLLDEVMVSVTSGELSPLVTGLVYCSVIEGCQQVYAVARACEWTSSLARWCEEQPELVAFRGVCLVHRAEIMQIQGAWKDAIVEAQRACERCREAGNKRAVAGGYYQLAELHRLHGDYTSAEEAYRNASDWGLDPQPGLALLRLAQGRVAVAAASLRRVLGVTKDPWQRLRVLPAYVETMLAAGEFEQAKDAARELDKIASESGTRAPSVLDAIAASARGAIELVEGDATAALVSMREAWRIWQEVDAPYLAARVRVLIGEACRALHDDDASRLELDAARAIFEELGAVPDVERIDGLMRGSDDGAAHGLTARELQVLRLLAAGKKNKVIASELYLSERTVDRHVSSILDKLNVSSRAAATGYAYEHKLI